MKDENGEPIAAGDVVRFVVGIPGREVVATVIARRGHLVVKNDEGTMSLRQTLKWYNVEKINK